MVFRASKGNVFMVMSDIVFLKFDFGLEENNVGSYHKIYHL